MPKRVAALEIDEAVHDPGPNLSHLKGANQLLQSNLIHVGLAAKRTGEKLNLAGQPCTLQHASLVFPLKAHGPRFGGKLTGSHPLPAGATFLAAPLTTAVF